MIGLTVTVGLMLKTVIFVGLVTLGAVGVSKTAKRYGPAHPVQAWRKAGRKQKKMAASAAGARRTTGRVVDEIVSSEPVQAAGRAGVVFGRGAAATGRLTASKVVFRGDHDKCLRCGRGLSDPDFRRIGYGPECVDRMPAWKRRVWFGDDRPVTTTVVRPAQERATGRAADRSEPVRASAAAGPTGGGRRTLVDPETGTAYEVAWWPEGMPLLLDDHGRPNRLAKWEPPVTLDYEDAA